tara:strand:- start:1709 stop:1948 length:240 start_codon:yes stop_codon:yes gene_type:complete
LENDFVDVFVEDITGYVYTIVVTTPTNLLKVMNADSVNFIKPEDDGYRLKLHQFTSIGLEISILNNLLEEHRKELDTFD